MEVAPDSPQIVCPEPNARSFTVGGVVYTRTENLAIARGRYLDRLLVEDMYSAYLPDHAKTLDRIIEHLNKVQHAQASHEIIKLREAHNWVANNRLRALEICGLWYNSADEDPTTYEYEAMKFKCYTAWKNVALGFFNAASLSLWNGAGSYSTLIAQGAISEKPAPS